jgi:hypothetical protein
MEALRNLLVPMRDSDPDSDDSPQSLFELAKPPTQPGSPPFCKKAQKCADNLDRLLHEVLETVLAEAMARDVIVTVYKPRAESLDVLVT